MPPEFTDHCYFEDLDMDMSTSSVKKDNVTRWNSKCVMIESILANRAVIRRLLLKYNKIELLLSHGEIYFLKRLLKCLMPFRKCTEILQGDKYPTISLVLPMLELLSQEEDNEEDGEEDLDLERGELLLLKADLLILKENMKSSIERRFRRAENPVYVLATSLDIRWKGTSSFITNPDELKTAIENFDRALKQRMTTMRTTTNQRPTHFNRQEHPQESLSSAQSASSVSSRNTKKSSKVAALLGGLLDSRSLPVENDALKKEIALYLSTPLISRNDLDSFDLLNWWKVRQDQFPLLSVVARKVLGIPATSACCERIFSKGGNIVSSLRANISPHNVDMTIFIAFNTQGQGIPNSIQTVNGD
jgi:hypothetical protein